MQFKDRLTKALNEKQMRLSDLSKITGISKGTLSNYIAGRYLPKLINLLLISDALGVSALWLYTGKEKP